MRKMKSKVISSAMAVVLALGMAPGLAFAGQAGTEAPAAATPLTLAAQENPATLAQGYYAATVASDCGMAKIVQGCENTQVYSDADGNAILFVKLENSQGKYDALWKGKYKDRPQVSAEDNTATAADADLIYGIPIPAEPGFSGTMWEDVNGVYGVKGATYKGLLFAVPLTSDELKAGQVYWQIRRSTWGPSNPGKWMGTNGNDYSFTFTVGSAIAGTASAAMVDLASAGESPTLKDVVTTTAALPSVPTADDLDLYLNARNAYQEFAGLYSCVAYKELESKSYKTYDMTNQIFMDNVLPEVEAMLDATVAALPDTVYPDGEYTFLVNKPTGKNYGVNTSLIASGRIPSATLTVKDGKMSLRFQATSTSYTYAFIGTPAEAAALEAEAHAAGKELKDVSQFLVAEKVKDENGKVKEAYWTIPLSSLNKPVYMTWRSDSSNVWFVRGSLYSSDNCGTPATIALCESIDALLNDALNPESGYLKFRIDPAQIEEADRAAIEAVLKDFEALTPAEQESLQHLYFRAKIQGAEGAAEFTPQSYARIIETASWGLATLTAVDNSTTLADGEYTNVVSTSTKGYSESPRVRTWSVPKIAVAGGKATATLVSDQSSTYTKIRANGQWYDNKAAAGEKSTFEVPIAIGQPLTFIATSSTMGTSIAYQVTAFMVPKVTLADQAKTFTGEALAYDGEIDKGGSEGEATLAYFADAACTQPVEAADVKAVGTYFVTATVAASGIYAEATSEPAKFEIEKAATKVTAKNQAKTYTGKALAYDVADKVTVTGSTGKVTVKYYSDAECTKVVKASQVKKTGVYYVKVSVAADDSYLAGEATAKFTVKVASNKAEVAKTSITRNMKAKKLAKQAATIALPTVKTTFGKAKWSVYKANKKGVLTLKGTNIKVKKGAKAGTYTIKVRAAVEKTDNYKGAKTKVVTVTVTVK